MGLIPVAKRRLCGILHESHTTGFHLKSFLYLGMVALLAAQSADLKVKIEGRRVRSQPGLHSEFNVNLGY